MQMNPQGQTTTNDAGIEKLKDCLRGELAAEETYLLALKSITHVGLHRTLQDILSSHARRRDLLREKLWELKADTPTSSGVWGAFVKAIQAGADLLGDRTAIAALEEGEDRGLKLYTEDLDGCDAKTRKFILTELLPEQRRTHDLCRTLKSYVNTPS